MKPRYAFVILTESLAGVLAGAAAVLPGACLVAGLAGAQPFSNGDFEKPGQKAIPKGQAFLTLNAPSQDIPGWQVGGGDIDYVPASYWQAAGKSFSLDLNGFNTGSIFQVFDTKAGAKYQVSFCLAGNPDGGPNPKKMEVAPQKADGTNVQGPTAYEFDASNTTRKEMKWVRKDLPFTGYDSSTKLSFNSKLVGAFGPTLDEVALLSPSEFKETPLVVAVLKSVDVADTLIADMVKEANVILKEQANINLKVVLKERDIENRTGEPPQQDGILREKNISKFVKILLDIVNEHVFKKGKGYVLLLANDIGAAVGNPNALAFTTHSQTEDQPITFFGMKAAAKANLTAAQLGSTLAHEIAHYLTLAGVYTIDCGVASDAGGHHQTDKNNLMFAGSADRTGSMLTPHQKAEISGSRSRVRGIAKAITSPSTIVSLPTRTTSWTDDLEDVSTGYIDLSWGSVFVDFNNTLIDLSLQLNGMFPGNPVDAQYDFFIDTKNKSGTGQAPDAFSGADKIVHIRLTGLFPFTDPGAFTGQVVDVATGVVSAVNPGFTERAQVFADAEPPNTSTFFDGGDTLLQRLPLSLLGSLADQVPIGVRATNLTSGEIDTATFVYAYNPPPGPQLQMSPLSGTVGTTIQLTGALFPASLPVTISVDDTTVATTNALSDGSIATSFAFPQTAVNCDRDANGVIDIRDINAIFAARNTTEKHFITATADNGTVQYDFSIFERTRTTNDARFCALQCAKPNCAQ